MIFTQIDQTYQIRFRNYNIFLLSSWNLYPGWIISCLACHFVITLLFDYLVISYSFFGHTLGAKSLVRCGRRLTLTVQLITFASPNQLLGAPKHYLVYHNMLRWLSTANTFCSHVFGYNHLKMNRNFTNLSETIRFFSVLWIHLTANLP